MPHTALAASLDESLRTTLDALAAERGLSSEEYAAEAIRRAVETDQDFRAFIQVGIDAADCGDLIPHEQVMAELDTMIAEHRAQCQKLA
jgi:predicted transcriptional regulator